MVMHWVAAIVLAVSVSSAAEVATKKWRRNPFFDDKLPVTVNPMTSFPANRRACAVRCSGKDWCQSFFFSSMSQACVLQGRMHSPLPSDVQAAGYRYYSEDIKECPAADGYVVDWSSLTCLRVVRVNMTWTDAHNFCHNSHGAIAVLTSEAKVKFVHHFLSYSESPIPATGYFIGAARLHSQWGVPVTQALSLNFVWWDSKGPQTVDLQATRDFWNPGEPDGYGAEDVVAILNNLKWVDSLWQVPRFFICEKPLTL